MYFVTTIGKFRKTDDGYDDIRCVGYFKLFNQAEFAILNNCGDIHETNYQYAVIENFGPGLYPLDLEENWWYEWNKDKEEYVRINKPEIFKGFVNFAIG